MDALQKFEALREICTGEEEFNQIVEKLLNVKLGQQRQRLERYEQELHAFEHRHGLDSATFYRRFEAGELGDDMDFCEWAGLVELRDDLRKKIECWESAA